MYQSKIYNRKQYKDSSNLKKRIGIYHYNSNPENWYNWVFRHLPITPGSRILELGCGGGDLWLKNADKIPDTIDLTLTDLNQGMLDDCAAALENLKIKPRFSIAEIEKIPFAESSFDLVIANHVLYHLSNVRTGLKEIVRVLKKNGSFAASANGVRDNSGMKDLLLGYDDRIPFHPEIIADKFCIDNGDLILREFFSEILKIEYANQLEIPIAEPIILYAQSVTGFSDIVTDMDDFKKYIEQKINKGGGKLIIKRTAGMYVCKNTTL